MLEMTLADIEKSYIEAKDRKTQIGILADLNGKETTFMAMLLREMGLDVAAEKMPRKSRNGADPYELFQLTPAYAEAVKYRTEHGRELGSAIGYTAKPKKPQEPIVEEEPNAEQTVEEHPKKERDTKLGDSMRLAIYMWGSYLEYTYGSTITRDDVTMLERLIDMTGK